MLGRSRCGGRACHRLIVCSWLEEEFGGYLELAGAVEGVVGAVDGSEGVDAGAGEGGDAALDGGAGGGGGVGGGAAERVGCLGGGGGGIGELGVGAGYAGGDGVVEQVEGLGVELELDGLVDGDVARDA